MFVAIIIFNTSLSKSNLQKMLKEQSQELYNDFEELKTEVRGAAQSIINNLKKWGDNVAIFEKKMMQEM